MTDWWRQWQGRVIDGKYRLDNYLGGSEQTAVFLTDFGSPEIPKAAIKIVRTEAQASNEVISGWREAARLSHPALIQLLDMGYQTEASGERLVYLVMQYAEEKLSEVIPDRPLDNEEVKGMLPPVLDALRYLHDNGFVHGGLTPSNIMAIGDQVKIASDSIKPAGHRPHPVRAVRVYDPPEIASTGLTPAGDVWTLGVTLAEVLTQRPPVWDRTGQVTLPRSTDPVLAGIVRQSLKKEPDHRWTVDQIADRLRGLPVEPVEEPPAVSAVPPAAEVAPPAKPLQTAPAPENAPARRKLGGALLAAAAVVAAVIFGSRLTDRDAAEQKPSTAPPVAASGPPARRPPAAETVRPRQPERQATSVKGAVLHRVLPEVPRQARSTIRGRVRVNVRVQVDPSGNVTSAKVLSTGSRYFSKFAVDAAQDWKFRPPALDGRNVASNWQLRFEFDRSTTNVSAVQLSR